MVHRVTAAVVRVRPMRAPQTAGYPLSLVQLWTFDVCNLTYFTARIMLALVLGERVTWGSNVDVRAVFRGVPKPFIHALPRGNAHS